MHVNDEISHVGIVNCLLRLGLPGRISGGIVRINTDDVELTEIPELAAVEVDKLTAENQMKQLSARGLVRHVSIFR